MIGRHGSHVGSSVMTVTGPVSFALAMSPAAGGLPLAVCVVPPPPSRVKSNVVPTDMAMTSSTATPISNHLRLLFLGG